MKNFYAQLDEKIVADLREYFMSRIPKNKQDNREYKSLQREVFLMTACLLKSPVYDWQNRKDLQ